MKYGCDPTGHLQNPHTAANMRALRISVSNPHTQNFGCVQIGWCMQARVHVGGVSKSNQRSISDESGDSVNHIKDGKLMCWPRRRPTSPPPQNATQSPQIRCASQLQKRQEHNLCPDYDRLFYSTSRHSWGDLTFRSVTIDLQMSKCGKNASSLTAKSVRLPKPCETDARVLERLAIMILATLLWSAGIIFRWLWNATRLQMRNKKTRYMIKG